MKTFANAVVAFACLLSFVACSSTPSGSAGDQQAVPKVAKKDPIPYTGKPCFTRMVDQAERWSPDALPFHLESKLNSESNGQGGKSTVWTGMFASLSRGKYKTFTCSGSVLLDEPAMGVSSGTEWAYSAEVPALLFHPAYLIADSDKAYEAAQEKGGAALMEKNPQQPVVYTLDWDASRRQLTWVVIYGESTKSAKGIGLVDAASGKYLRGR